VASPFTQVANATATFSLPAAGTITDSLGNVTPAMEPVTYTLFLKMGGRVGVGALAPASSDLPGAGYTSEIMEGYCVSPMSLDDRIQLGTTGTLVFAGEPEVAITVIAARFYYGSEGFIGQTLTEKLGHRLRLRRQYQAIVHP
jgi:hypothetical protein